jgi:peptidoglycan/LPS O-acetylase OafA/YrhL
VQNVAHRPRAGRQLALCLQYRAFESRADQLFWGCLLAIALNRKWFPGVLRALRFAFGARISYSFYLYHLVPRSFGALFREDPSGSEWPVPVPWWSPFRGPVPDTFAAGHAILLSWLAKMPSILLGFAISVGLASLSYVVVEKRFLRPRKLVEPEAATAAAG